MVVFLAEDGPAAKRLTDVESVVVDAWTEALGTDDFDLDEIFFEVGGSLSLAVARKLIQRGLGGRPGATTVAELWSNISAGRATITELTRGELVAAGVTEETLDDPAYVPARGTISDPERFDEDFFGIPPKEAASMAPQHRLLPQTAWEVLESANLTGDAPFGRVGVFAGAGTRDGDTVHAVIKGSAIDNDGGAKVGYTAPGMAGQVDVLARAYASAGVDPASVGYVEAHGTATEMGTRSSSPRSPRCSAPGPPARWAR